MFLFYLLVFLLFYINPTNSQSSQYAGYNAAGRNSGWRSGSEHAPLDVPNVYHKPNKYENQHHSYWYENKPFPHAHVGHPDTYTGKLHRHRPDDDVPSSQNFITDPPGVGLNAPDQQDNFKTTTSEVACNSNDSSGCSTHVPTQVHPSTPNPRLPYKSAHAVDEDIEFENEASTDSQKVVSAHETELVLDEVGGAAKKKPCCPCCRDEESSTKSTAVQVHPTTLATPRSSIGAYAKGKSGRGYQATPNNYPSSSSGGGFSYPNSAGLSYATSSGAGFSNPFSAGGGFSYLQNPFGFGQSSSYGCGSSYSSSYYGSGGGCCGQQLQLPSCCLPQLPCCPKIEFPCCPQQPICCQPVQGCGTCRSRVLKQRRTKRFGCIPCAGRRKREVLDEIHVRRKRLGCVPCLRRRKREQPRCRRCSPFTTHLVQRVKRKVQQACSESKRSGAVSRRLSWTQAFGLRTKRAIVRDHDYDSVFDCDRQCCDYSKCIRSKPLATLKH